MTMNDEARYGPVVNFARYHPFHVGGPLCGKLVEAFKTPRLLPFLRLSLVDRDSCRGRRIDRRAMELKNYAAWNITRSWSSIVEAQDLHPRYRKAVTWIRACL